MPNRTGVVACFGLVVMLGVPSGARAQGDSAYVPPHQGDVSPQAPLDVELMTLRQLEERHRRHRSAYAWGTLASGLVFTGGVPVVLTQICIFDCDGRPSVGARVGATMVVVGGVGLLISGLAAIAHSASLRRVRRRIVALSVEPMVSSRLAGAQLALTW